MKAISIYGLLLTANDIDAIDDYIDSQDDEVKESFPVDSATAIMRFLHAVNLSDFVGEQRDFRHKKPTESVDEIGYAYIVPFEKQGEILDLNDDCDHVPYYYNTGMMKKEMIKKFQPFENMLPFAIETICPSQFAQMVGVIDRAGHIQRGD